MKILFVASRFHTNQYYCVQALQRAGHQVKFHVVNVGSSEDHTLLAPDVIERSRLFRLICHLLNKRNDEDFARHYMLPSLPTYIQQFKAFDPDLVVIRDPSNVPSAVALVVAKAFARKVILYTQGPKYFRSNPFKSMVRSAALTVLACGWITPVRGEAGPGRQTHDGVHYLPFVVESESHPKRDWFRGDRVNILAIGKLVPRKNHRLLLGVLRQLVRRHQVSLTIVGQCTSRDHELELHAIRQHIREGELEPYVTIKTNLSFQAVQREYLDHDLFVLPSSGEPAGVSLLEAMGKGLPVVCSDSNGTKDYVQSGVNGWIFRSGCAEDLEAVLDRIGDRRRLMRMGEQSLRIAQQHHSPESYCDALVGIAHARNQKSYLRFYSRLRNPES